MPKKKHWGIGEDLRGKAERDDDCPKPIAPMLYCEEWFAVTKNGLFFLSSPIVVLGPCPGNTLSESCFVIN